MSCFGETRGWLAWAFAHLVRTPRIAQFETAGAGCERCPMWAERDWGLTKATQQRGVRSRSGVSLSCR